MVQHIIHSYHDMSAGISDKQIERLPGPYVGYPDIECIPN